MKAGRVKEVIREIAEIRQEREHKRAAEALKVDREKRGQKIENKQTIHINLISSVEMKAHTKEMRAENDRNFVRVLEVAGLTKAEAHSRVKEWHAQDGWY